MKLNGTCQLMAFDGDDVNMLRESVHNTKKKTLVVGSMEIGLDVNADRTKYNDLSRDLNAGKNHNIGKQAINRSRMRNRSDILEKN